MRKGRGVPEKREIVLRTLEEEREEAVPLRLAENDLRT